MQTTRVSKQMLETIREKTHDIKPVRDFLLELVAWETSSEATYHFRDRYKSMVKEYSRRMGGEDED